MLHIDPFAATDVEYAAVVAVNHALYADDDSNVDEMRHYDSTRNPAYLYQRYVLRWDDDIAGYGMLYVPYWAYVPGRYSLYIAVHPTYQRRGIGSAFYDFALAQLAQQEEAMNVLHAHARSETPQGIRFLEERGFVQVMRWWDSRLDLAKFAPEDYAPLLAKLAAAGVEIITAAEFALRNPDWQRSIYAVDREATLDEPQPTPPTPLSYEDYCKFVFDNPNFRAERIFVAVDGDRAVGMTELPLNPVDPANLHTGFTGIGRSHRRRGIATALKAAALTYAKETGAQTVATGNEENNPMYAINLQMGFEPTGSRLAYEKQF